MTTCYLCGHSGHDVRVALARFRQPVDGELFGSMPRCQDAAACRQRVEQSGEAWELADTWTELRRDEVPA